MDTRTGQIIILDDNTPEPPPYFARLGNLPATGCPKCKGAGVKRITAQGRRIPCACTNPRP
jgi:hypothetical protein